MTWACGLLFLFDVGSSFRLGQCRSCCGGRVRLGSGDSAAYLVWVDSLGKASVYAMPPALRSSKQLCSKSKSITGSRVVASNQLAEDSFVLCG